MHAQNQMKQTLHPAYKTGTAGSARRFNSDIIFHAVVSALTNN